MAIILFNLFLNLAKRYFNVNSGSGGAPLKRCSDSEINFKKVEQLIPHFNRNCIRPLFFFTLLVESERK